MDIIIYIYIYIDIWKVIDTQSQSQLRWIDVEIFTAHVLVQHGGYQTNAAAVYTLLDDSFLWKLCGHKPMNNFVRYSLGSTNCGVALTWHITAYIPAAEPQWHVQWDHWVNEIWILHSYGQADTRSRMTPQFLTAYRACSPTYSSYNIIVHSWFYAGYRIPLMCHCNYNMIVIGEKIAPFIDYLL